MGTWSGVASTICPDGDLSLIWVDAHMELLGHLGDRIFYMEEIKKRGIAEVMQEALYRVTSLFASAIRWSCLGNSFVFRTRMARRKMLVNQLIRSKQLRVMIRSQKGWLGAQKYKMNNGNKNIRNGTETANAPRKEEDQVVEAWYSQ
ncbi:hypothetical protein KIN20_020162 [Parelaphostrongylus tenuis]|uniref:Uncharacterized protein n=1 Tax=Parelaphostrongylus tenuis TaxID=148309 RepID=A0AAD5QTD3_PARTN|nr:hypothetical protein KIN20_020162 [Parelaphostrongylus tenuis]